MTDIYKCFNWDLALKRVCFDTRTDFLFIPQFTEIYLKAEDNLQQLVKTPLSHSYCPMPPIILAVAKENGLTRPGGALWPLDRLIYQAIADSIAPDVESSIDRTRVFSNQIDPDISSEQMFKPHSACYRELQDKIKEIVEKGILRFTVIADVNSYFEHINIHQFESGLSSLVDNRMVKFLDNFLKSLASRQSRGLVQGLFPSDLLGNLYLCPFDERVDAMKIPSLRYVDDLFFFFKTQNAASRFRASLPELLRHEGLSLNESKTHVIESKKLYHIETGADRLFSEAREEVEAAVESTGSWFESYGDQSEWGQGGGLAEYDIELEATKRLFDLIPRSSKNDTKICKFALPLLGAMEDDYALDYVAKKYIQYPHLASTFSSYLARLSHKIDIKQLLCSFVKDEGLFYASHVMWFLALLSITGARSPESLRFARDIWLDRSQPDVVRGNAGLYLAKCGTANHRKLIRDAYTNESELIKTFILFSTQHYPEEECKALQRAWGKQTAINNLILTAMRKS